MSILILGGTGFFGTNLTMELEKRGMPFNVASRTTGCDLRDLDATVACLETLKPDRIINLAAVYGSLGFLKKHAAEVVRDNMLIYLNVYEATRRVCPDAWLINPVSNCSYPGDSDIQKEAEWWGGPIHESVLSFGSTRRMIYVIAECNRMQYGTRSVNLIVPNSFGPNDSTDVERVHALNGMIIRMIRAKRDGQKEFEIWGTGKPVREWVYVDDVVELLIQALETEHDLTYPVNMGQNRGYSIGESAKAIADALGFEGKLVFNTKYADGAPVKILDGTKFGELFPEFTFSDHREGIRRTVEYYERVL